MMKEVWWIWQHQTGGGVGLEGRSCCVFGASRLKRLCDRKMRHLFSTLRMT